jgi:hypothetical protein
MERIREAPTSCVYGLQVPHTHTHTLSLSLIAWHSDLKLPTPLELGTPLPTRNATPHESSLTGEATEHWRTNSYLDGFAEVFSLSFLLNDRLVDLAGGDVVITTQTNVHEPLVVSQIQIRLSTIVQHKHLGGFGCTHTNACKRDRERKVRGAFDSLFCLRTLTHTCCLSHVA